MLPNPRHIVYILIRFWYEYKQLWRAQFVRDFLDRLIYLLAFGFGMGGVMATSHGGDYLAFLVPGIAASTGVFVMTMAMTYGVWERSSSYKVWQAWLATPIRLGEIMLAELVYASLRALPSVFILTVLAYVWLDALPSPMGALMSIPVLLIANLTMGAIAMCFTVHIRRPIHFAYVTTLWTTPMFLMGGTFFDMHNAPVFMQWISWVFPLSHVIAVVRPLMLGHALPLETLASSLGLLMFLFIGGYSYALWQFKKRLVE